MGHFRGIVSIHRHEAIDTHTLICEANKVVVTLMLDDAATVVRRAFRDIDSSIGHDNTIDLSVSCNGSWMTRGHKSQYGIDCFVEVITGLVIDVQVMSLYCQRCSYASTRHGGMHTAAFKEWYVTHELDCSQHYEGVSGGMEVKAARCCCGSASPTATSGTPP